MSEEVLDQAELSTISPSERNAAIMRAVRVAVRADPKKMWVLITVLEKFAESAPLAVKMRGALEILHKLAGE